MRKLNQLVIKKMQIQLQWDNTSYSHDGYNQKNGKPQALLGCGEIEILVYHWWDYKMMQAPWKKVWLFLKKITTYHMTH